MNRLPSISAKKLLKLLTNNGFYIKRQSGSHMMLRHTTDHTKRVTLPLHNKDLKRKTLLSVLKQAGLDKNILTKH